ncbi:MAG: hydrolase 1, exosortase A system-associated [Gammaproteobacteria bacterium]|nr:hydrolase 1, exosortase A system-associated [Gammaproteobacteria bacterium]
MVYKVEEKPVIIPCEGDRMIGVLHQPDCASHCGVLIVVGGPQTRVGSHRQFVLLSRFLASNGVPVLRFDYRGMGDSEGDIRSYGDIDDDIGAAVDLLQKYAKIDKVILWGLCDAASASLFYAWKDDRVKGLILLNPWIRTQSGIARAYIRSHYPKRIFSRDFWRKLWKGEFSFSDSVPAFLDMLKRAARKTGWETMTDIDDKTSAVGMSDQQLLARVAKGVSRFQGKILVVLSGNDLTADEFRNLLKDSSKWRSLFDRDNIAEAQIANADHTFSRLVWSHEVERLTLSWINQL